MKTVSVRRSLARVGVGALLVAVLHSTFAQAPAPAAAQQSGLPTTTIKASTRLVTVDVIVQDRKNQPVPGLAKDDFDLFEDGQPQSISVFSIEGQAAPGATPPKPLPPGIFSNRSNLQANVPASATVILLDNLNTTATQLAMARGDLAKFLRELQPQDRVALYSMGRGLRVVQDFTNDSALLSKGLKDLHPEPPGAGGPQFSSLTAPSPILDPTGEHDQLKGLWGGANVDTTLRTFEAIGEHLAGFPGRKTLIWISQGFPQVIRVRMDKGKECEYQDMTPRIQKASQVLSRYNVALYPMDTRGLIGSMTEISSSNTPEFVRNNPAAGASAMTQSSPAATAAASTPSTTGTLGNAGSLFGNLPTTSCLGQNKISEMEETHSAGMLLAQLTGGRTYYDQNDLTYGMRSALDDSKLVYVLGYYPAQDKWDSHFHTFKVQVKQPGLKLIYRSGYLATPEPTTLTAEDPQTVLEKAAIAPLDSSVIGLFARVQKSGANVQGPTIDLVVDVADLRLNHDSGRWKGNLEVVIAQLTPEGDLIETAARQHTARLDVQDDYYAKLQASGLQLFFPFAPDPKAATIRVVIRSAASGAIGTLSIPVSAI